MDKEWMAARTIIKRERGCKNPEECSATTNITEDIECGWGGLDNMGFWAHSCETCTKILRALIRR